MNGPATDALGAFVAGYGRPGASRSVDSRTEGRHAFCQYGLRKLTGTADEERRAAAAKAGTPADFASRRLNGLDLSGLDVPHDQVDEATAIDLDEWRQELESQGEFFASIGPSMPRTLELQRELLLSRIESMHGKWVVR